MGFQGPVLVETQNKKLRINLKAKASLRWDWPLFANVFQQQIYGSEQVTQWPMSCWRCSFQPRNGDDAKRRSINLSRAPGKSITANFFVLQLSTNNEVHDESIL